MLLRRLRTPKVEKDCSSWKSFLRRDVFNLGPRNFGNYHQLYCDVAAVFGGLLRPCFYACQAIMSMSMFTTGSVEGQ